MSIVTLVSGGIDSTLMTILAHEEGIEVFPLFVDYGQLSVEKEWAACCYLHSKHQLPSPLRMNLSGFGKLISSGITDKNKRINEDAFLPGRNLLLILVGASYAFNVGADGVAIGLLNEESRLFPDQTKDFINSCESTIQGSFGKYIHIIAPMIKFSKFEVMEMLNSRNIVGTYSCHSGNDAPCGKCISCMEIKNSKERR